ncbi:permease prefix domain 1-containing protein [Salipaludibacillus sp. LMS25]|jgi:hypothetical protein|uniref:permease prefix domain 1-containing protein n=1 Tax=Salipaludibacillus sp. LMS25 TaxID=2924031 RepID=UPI0020D039B6|nr:permease prefix domain 1-containing protein [Salipaludibacillus sp. LMS25]UTR16492.1 permease prefix domain 1-containing protein [Salipaludibacillus sp. LMS25]
MKQIDEYVNAIYRHVNGKKEEISDLKHEMRSHLIEAVHELKEQGKSEEEAVRIAIENFGEKPQLIKGLSEFFTMQKRFTRYVLGFALVSLVLASLFLVHALIESKMYREALHAVEEVEIDRQHIMDDIFSVLQSSHDLSNVEEEQLIDVFEKYQEKLNLIAVFRETEVEDWLEENEFVYRKPTTILPIDYSHASIVISNKGIVQNMDQIVPSNYDLGTVVKASTPFVIQYEYKDSYRNIVEEHHQLNYYGPNSLHQLPLLFFVISIVLGVIWVFLEGYSKQLKRVIG